MAKAEHLREMAYCHQRSKVYTSTADSLLTCLAVAPLAFIELSGEPLQLRYSASLTVRIHWALSPRTRLIIACSWDGFPALQTPVPPNEYAIRDDRDRSTIKYLGSRSPVSKGHSTAVCYDRGMTTAKCSTCKQTKTANEFYKNVRSPNGIQSNCRLCAYAYRNKWSKDNSEKLRTYERIRKRLPERNKLHNRRRRLRQYGLTLDSFAALLALQGNACAICRASQPRGGYNQWHVDHEHGTVPVRVRGLLCSRCNTGLGHFSDNPAALLAAAAYLSSPTAVQ